MTIVLDNADRILAKLDKLEAILMSWQDSFTKLSADFDALATRVNAHLDDLKGQVTTLTTQLQGADIPADAQATLDALDAKITAFDVPTQAPAPQPTVPPGPPVTPTS